ncbi:MAG TPA: glycosyltransferase [Blastocatellia bacterium]|nr:glycosyltransferase [Blastocatellia bacterium]
MKTLHITNAFHASSGGVATSYKALMREANRNGRLMRLVVPSDRDRVERVGECGLIYHVAAPHSRMFDTRYRTILPHRYLLSRSGPIWNILKAEQPDLLEVRDKFCLNWLGGLFRKSWHEGVKRPVLVGCSSERMDDNLAAYVVSGNAGVRFARLYMRYCYVPLFDFHLANSSYTAEEITASMTAKHSRPVFVRSEGIDCEVFRPDNRDPSVRRTLLSQTGGNTQSLLLLYCGRLAPEKNVALLADIMERLSACDAGDYRLAVAGAGPLAADLENRLKSRAPRRFALLGHVPERAELARLYASCDIFIHPNPREPFGIAPLEAMASGLAVVVPSSGGVLSYANDSNAWLAEPTAESFAEAAIQASNPEARLAKGLNARKTAERHDWPVVATELFTLFDQLTESRSRAIARSQPSMRCLYG